VGGGENRILNIARSIDRSRFDYSVASLYAPLRDLDAQHGSMRNEFASAGIDVLDLNLPRPGSKHRGRLIRPLQTAARLLRVASRLARYIAHEQIDLLDAHLEGTLLPAIVAAMLTRIPVAMTLYQPELLKDNRLLRPFARMALRHASAVITDSHVRAADFEAFMGPGSPQVKVIPNGVRLHAPICNRSDMLVKLALPEHAGPIIGQVSGFSSFKGHRVLLAAAKAVLKQRAGLYFICIGFPRAGQHYVEALKEYAEDLGIANSVRIQPYDGHIADVWQVIDVHVHASELDSLPNAIIEGMSLGKPAVVTDVGGIPSLVDHERTGLVVRAGDPHALAAAILQMIGNADLANTMGARARERYLARYSPEVTVREVENALLTVSDAYSTHRQKEPRGGYA
jgi:glycosyltransferase involved in cell wall biosynthesis